MDGQLTEETTEWKQITKTSPRFSPTTSLTSTTTTNTLVSTKTTTTTFYPDYPSEDQTNEIVSPTIENQSSEIPNPTIEYETSEIPNPTIEYETPEIPHSSVETAYTFTTAELITLLTTNSRAIFKATVRTTASTKSDKDITSKPETTATTEDNRYICLKITS
ncbi:MAG: hypothetical protein MJE68_09975 [Proteobacteria bacterium]|nr:hypothetical protein [Pseudomonadota bacterium]